MSNPMLRDFGAQKGARPQQGQYEQNGRIYDYAGGAGQTATADKLQGMYDQPTAGPDRDNSAMTDDGYGVGGARQEEIDGLRQ